MPKPPRTFSKYLFVTLQLGFINFINSSAFNLYMFLVQEWEGVNWEFSFSCESKKYKLL